MKLFWSTTTIKNRTKIELLTYLLRDFGPFFHYKLFQLVKIVCFLSMNIYFEHLLQNPSRIEIWALCGSPQALGFGVLVLALSLYLVGRPSDDLSRTEEQISSNYPSEGVGINCFVFL